MFTTGEKLVMGGVIAMLVFLSWSMIEGSRRDREEWERFSAAHQCKVVARIAGQSHTVLTSGANGQVQVGVVGTDDQTSYLCDDGVTYTR